MYQKGLLKSYSLENGRSSAMGEGIPLKKERNRWGRRRLMVYMNVKKKIVKKFLIIYFYLRCSIG